MWLQVGSQVAEESMKPKKTSKPGTSAKSSRVPSKDDVQPSKAHFLPVPASSPQLTALHRQVGSYDRLLTVPVSRSPPGLCYLGERFVLTRTYLTTVL